MKDITKRELVLIDGRMFATGTNCERIGSFEGVSIAESFYEITVDKHTTIFVPITSVLFDRVERKSKDDDDGEYIGRTD